MRRLFPLLGLTALLSASCSHEASTLTADEALDFLYASMPLPDSVDYPREYWVENIESALRARQEMPWGEKIPEQEWKHFVLPVRVNNEDLDRSRMVFYDELKERVKGLSMADAILEVNHWCHEHVTYKPSDERTSSPLATMRTAHGRCGEESTFLVAALRSVGIPARQVYTPRWAHTDDNHAWVEAWADGEWHFLGACEPEAVLDLGWFNAPASRGMLMHTKVFGAQYDGPEEVMQRNACFTEIDVTSHYAPVSRAYVKVVDTEGQIVPDATVEFKIYNYAEFYTVANKQVDANGITSLQAGLGDLVVWASQASTSHYGYSLCTVKSEPDTIEVTLNHQPGDRFEFDLEIVPPTERNTIPSMTEEQRLHNQLRLAQEDSIRNAYEATFATDDELLIASRGNHQTIRDFLAQATDQEKALALLHVITEKDLRDVPMEVLMDHYSNGSKGSRGSKGISDSEYIAYQLNPRVLNEKLTPYRQYFMKEVPAELQEQFKEDVSALIDWTRQHIAIDETSNPQQLRMTPGGVWQARRTDAVSRNIFFVAMARTMGHLAYVDKVNGNVNCYDAKSDRWLLDLFPTYSDANDEEEFVYCDLSLDYQPTQLLPDPKYYTHFTLSQLQPNGRLELMNYDESDTYRSLFATPRRMWPGNYLLVSGTRLHSGNVLVHGEMFPTSVNGKLHIPLNIRQATHGMQVIGSFNSENLYLDAATGQTKSLLSTTGRGYYIFGIIAPNNEPTSHALRDIVLCSKEIEQWGGKVMLIFRDEQERQRFRLSDYPELPSNVVFGSDIDDAMLRELCESLHLSDKPRQATLPIFIITDTFNRIVWYRQGYTIGLGEQLIKGLEATRS